MFKMYIYIYYIIIQYQYVLVILSLNGISYFGHEGWYVFYNVTADRKSTN